MVMKIGLLVCAKIGVRYDSMPLSGTKDAQRHHLGSRRFSQAVSFLIFFQGKCWHGCVICCICIVLNLVADALFSTLASSLLVVQVFFDAAFRT